MFPWRRGQNLRYLAAYSDSLITFFAVIIRDHVLTAVLIFAIFVVSVMLVCDACDNSFVIIGSEEIDNQANFLKVCISNQNLHYQT